MADDALLREALEAANQAAADADNARERAVAAHEASVASAAYSAAARQKAEQSATLIGQYLAVEPPPPDPDRPVPVWSFPFHALPRTWIRVDKRIDLPTPESFTSLPAGTIVIRCARDDAGDYGGIFAMEEDGTPNTTGNLSLWWYGLGHVRAHIGSRNATLPLTMRGAIESPREVETLVATWDGRRRTLESGAFFSRVTDDAQRSAVVAATIAIGGTRWSDGKPNDFHGWILGVDIYNRVLTEEEITALAADPVPELPPPPPPPPPTGSLEPIDQSIQQVALTVESEPQQTWRGVGVSQKHSYNPMSIGNAAEREMVLDTIFTHWGATALRLWGSPGQEAMLITSYKPLVEEFKARGGEFVFFGYEPYRPGDPTGSAKTIASFTKAMMDGGIPITHVGTANEPGSAGRPGPTLSEGIPLYQTLRAELDSRGLSALRMMAPEYASFDSKPREWFDHFQANQALGIYGSPTGHSYNMAANRDMAGRAKSIGRGIIQTECGGSHDQADWSNIPTATARLLNDMNNYVEIWIWFIGWGPRPDIHQKLVLSGPTEIMPLYEPLRAASLACPPGTVMRHVTSSLPGNQGGTHMVWTYGVKPKMTSASGRRPDGTWFVAAQNSTWGSFVGGGFGHHGAETIQGTWTVPELMGKSARWKLTRVDAEGKVSEGETHLVGGQLRVTLPPGELAVITGGV